MRFSEEELVFFNGVTKGETPFGIFLYYPTEEKIEEYKKKVLKSLQEKGILNEEEKFTKEGIAVVMAWEEYRNCKKHLIFNRLYLAMLPNRRVIGLIRAGKEYEFFISDSAAVMMGFWKKHEFLRQGNTEGSYKMEKIPYSTWEGEIEKYGENILMYGEYRGKNPQKEEVYYWKGNIGYRYDMNTGYRRQMGSRAMRLQILKNLGITKEQING